MGRGWDAEKAGSGRAYTKDIQHTRMFPRASTAEHNSTHIQQYAAAAAVLQRSAHLSSPGGGRDSGPGRQRGLHRLVAGEGRQRHVQHGLHEAEAGDRCGRGRGGE